MMDEMTLRPDDGEQIGFGPNEVTILLDGEDTGGTFSLLKYSAPPGGPVPPVHVHEETDEIVHVLEGTVECQIEDETITAGAGTTVTIPRGTVHTIGFGDGPEIRFLFLFTPAGFEDYFRDLGEFVDSFPDGELPTDQVAEKTAELNEIYDQTIPDAE